MNPLTESCLRYLDGDLSEQEAKAFDRLIAESRDAARELARHLIDEHYYAKVQATPTEGRIDASDGSSLNLAIRHIERHEEADEVLQELARLESEAPVIRLVEDQAEVQPYRQNKEALDWKEVSNAMGFVFGSAARSTSARWIAAAAAVALCAAITLLLLFGGGGSEPDRIVEDRPDTPEVDTTRVVATLIAEHDAVWDRRPGEELYVGQRLTLAKGFAEITTEEGAIVILEAPAIVELLDSNNALYLHTGKLVGLCHTESSKGFVVKTDHADVTDLGTEFGVEAGPDGIEATVFVGEVEINVPGRLPRRVQHSQTARLSSDEGTDRELVVEHRAAKGFVRRLPRPALIAAASINLDGFTVEVVPNGVYEDAKLYTDRDHELNGIDEAGLPPVLIGGDLVRMPASARPHLAPEVGDNLRLEIELTRPADIYALVSTNAEVGGWLERDYVRTGMQTGVDYVNAALRNVYNGGVGPGESIDNIQEVWKRKQPAVGRIVAGESLRGGAYAIVAVPHPSPDQKRTGP